MWWWRNREREQWIDGFKAGFAQAVPLLYDQIKAALAKTADQIRAEAIDETMQNFDRYVETELKKRAH